MVGCIPMVSARIVRKSANDSYGMSYISGCVATIEYIKKPIVDAYGTVRFHIFPLWIVSLRQPKTNAERGRSRFGRLHVEQLSLIADPTNLHTKNVSSKA